MGECDHRWKVIAFKPLRQVVEEMAKVAGARVEVMAQTHATWPTLFVRVQSKPCSFSLVSLDERTALLAAKAALDDREEEVSAKSTNARVSMAATFAWGTAAGYMLYAHVSEQAFRWLLVMGLWFVLVDVEYLKANARNAK